MQGIPLIASAPVKHEMSDTMSCHGYEVTKYQPPWKTFSEYAMHNDSDDCTSTPAFQHLVNQVNKNWLNFIFGLLKFDSPTSCMATTWVTTL